MSDVRHEWMRHFSEIEMRNDNNTHDGVVSHTRFRIMEDVVKNMLNNLQAQVCAHFCFSLATTNYIVRSWLWVRINFLVWRLCFGAQSSICSILFCSRNLSELSA